VTRCDARNNWESKEGNAKAWAKDGGEICARVVRKRHALGRSLRRVWGGWLKKAMSWRGDAAIHTRAPLPQADLSK
jgi:hypothetical protein